MDTDFLLRYTQENVIAAPCGFMLITQETADKVLMQWRGVGGGEGSQKLDKIFVRAFGFLCSQVGA